MMNRLLIFVLLAAAVASAQGTRGVMVREAQLRINPDETSAQLGAVSRGNVVAVMEQSHDWAKVFAQTGTHRNETGWILNKGIIQSTTPQGDSILFGAAEEAEAQAADPQGRAGAAQDAERLYARVREFFPKSRLAGEAMFRAADIQWQIDRSNSLSLPSAHEKSPIARAQIGEDAMREVIHKYPHTRWDDLASYDLIDNKLCGDWQGDPKCPEHETEIYLNYVKDHPQSPKAPEALYKAAWRQSALMEIYRSAGKTGIVPQAHDRALQITGELTSKYPQSGWAQRAAALAYFVQQGIPTYGSSKE